MPNKKTKKPKKKAVENQFIISHLKAVVNGLLQDNSDLANLKRGGYDFKKANKDRNCLIALQKVNYQWGEIDMAINCLIHMGEREWVKEFMEKNKIKEAKLGQSAFEKYADLMLKGKKAANFLKLLKLRH